MKSSLPTIIQQELDFSAYSLAFNSENVLFVGGGDGVNHSGVKNQLVSFTIDKENKKLTRVDSLLLSEKGDCPISITCHPQLPLLAAGINSSKDNSKQENNLNCKLFQTKDNKITLKQQISASQSKLTAEYQQKVIRYSKWGNYLVTAFSDGKVSVLNTKDWTLAFPVLQFKNLQDVDFDSKEEHMAIATLNSLTIISIKEKGRVIQVIDSPKLNKQTSCEIRAVRYATLNEQETLYAVVNSTSKGHGFICAWKLLIGQEYPVIKPRTASVSRKNITRFSVSPNGDILAFVPNDFSIHLIDVQTFKPLLKVNQAHRFAITDLVFSHSGEYLATSGADNQCKVMMLSNINEYLETSDEYNQVIYGILDMLLFALLMHIIVQVVDQGN
ncbi:hypothetical protein G6F57_008504 [Rhizopus arrhizus]|uniref:WD40 repeat-like protein n=1 Tax=Rhizopus oryzae TaxID=64495 RepID=A0A9P7BQC4_RHIOR|nr:hypothetical protein G6F23_003540 [Rhizopus arrhizus]KAG1411945.1 hypothetical protein G6F58_008281 [Rhizopus delemar]KAG0760300.1 hypothetical protein G6F24_008421 [Rhizopus arrhizus]KAG0786567.1 hypothetical protein G6F21_008506 [Rhizopus arrhizus]KAG0817224.1 hypothetical protein G6F20_002566 [Rhizopus arrhizus]